jgi:hypothetical protein
LDNCSAVTHIPTRPIITDSIGQRAEIIQTWDKAEYLEANNKLAKIIVPNKKYSSLLRKFAPFIVNISLLKDKLRKRK